MNTKKILILCSLVNNGEISHQLKSIYKAINDINKLGGVLGYKVKGELRLVNHDTNYSMLLKGDDSILVVGLIDSYCRKKIRVPLEKYNKTLWYPIHYEGFEESKNILYLGCCSNQFIEPLLKWLSSNQYNKIYVVTNNSTFSKYFSEILKVQINDFQIKILGENEINKLTFRETISSIYSLKPDIILNLNFNDNKESFFSLLNFFSIKNFFPIFTMSVNNIDDKYLKQIYTDIFSIYFGFDALSKKNATDSKEKSFKKVIKNNKINKVDTYELIINNISDSTYYQLLFWKESIDLYKTFSDLLYIEELRNTNYNTPLGTIRVLRNNHIARIANIVQLKKVTNVSSHIFRMRTIPKPWYGLNDVDISSKKTLKRLLDSVSMSFSNRALIDLQKIKYESLFEHLYSGVVIYKAINNATDFIFIDMNRAVEKIENINRSDIIGKRLLSVFPGVKKMGLFNILQKVYFTNCSENYPTAFYEDDNIKGWRENFIYKLPSGEVVAVYNDVTEKKHFEKELKKSNTRFELAAKSAGLGIWEYNIKLKKLYWDKKMLSLYKLEAINSRFRLDDWKQFIHPDDIEDIVSSFKKSLLTGSEYSSIFRIIWPNGEIRYIKAHSTIEFDNLEKPYLAVGINYDITDQKLSEKKIISLATTDSLTNLLNRRSMISRLDDIISLYKRNSIIFSLAILDIDHFKRVNDLYGHQCGDKVLQYFSKLLIESLRPYDVKCRYGGEEFIIITPDSSKEGTFSLISRVLYECRRKIFLFEKAKFSISFSAGIVDCEDFKEGNFSSIEIINLADKRLYHAKNNGRNQICYSNLSSIV